MSYNPGGGLIRPVPCCVCTQKTGRSGADPRVLHFGTLDFQLTRRLAEYATSKSALVPLGVERSALWERARSLTGELSQAGGTKYWVHLGPQAPGASTCPFLARWGASPVL